jgi:hypothetical protein
MKAGSWFVVLFAFGAVGSENLTFDSAPFGKVPPGWSVECTNGTARWEIRKDPTAPSQPYVFAQVSQAGGTQRSPLAVLQDTHVRDGEVSVKFKPVAGREDQNAGVVWRYRDPENYYVARANTLEKNVSVYRVQNGRRVPLAQRGKPGEVSGVNHHMDPSEWNILKVAFRGDTFSVYYDHRRILQVEDRAFRSAGKVGLWTEGDSVTYFDNFRFLKRQ